METLIKFRVSNPKFKILLKKIKTIKCNKNLTINNHYDTIAFVLKYDGKFNLYRGSDLILISASYIETFNTIEKLIKIKYIVDQGSNIEFFKELINRI
jgi:hypothetical protein